ncbi:hypothetical protein CYMTET_36160 [Cymbomonas tetramitiformis]|uniref:Uncharacterized protein n=1 Tax=Cymbomonas tetramitiformis TaxID=36881 RepID=A0AAE0CI85_9CHLO|nr:hypothetical protein CYMTET_36160 [Cymbomonas tetramitiformis]
MNVDFDMENLLVTKRAPEYRAPTRTLADGRRNNPHTFKLDDGDATTTNNTTGAETTGTGNRHGPRLSSACERKVGASRGQPQERPGAKDWSQNARKAQKDLTGQETRLAHQQVDTTKGLMTCGRAPTTSAKPALGAPTTKSSTIQRPVGDTIAKDSGFVPSIGYAEDQAESGNAACDFKNF